MSEVEERISSLLLLLLLRAREALLSAAAAQREEGNEHAKQATYSMREKRLRSLLTIIAPFGSLVAVRGTVRWVGDGQPLSGPICEHIPIRRGSGFEFGDALNETGDARFPQINSSSDQSDFGFCYFGVRYGR